MSREGAPPHDERPALHKLRQKRAVHRYNPHVARMPLLRLSVEVAEGLYARIGTSGETISIVALQSGFQAMSREAFGDEGNVPERWEDTQMYHAFHAMRSEWEHWLAAYKDYLPNDEFAKLAEGIDGFLSELSDRMTGPMP